MEGAGGLAVAGILAKRRESCFRQDVLRLYLLGFADAWRGWQLENHDVATRSSSAAIIARDYIRISDYNFTSAPCGGAMQIAHCFRRISCRSNIVAPPYLASNQPTSNRSPRNDYLRQMPYLSPSRSRNVATQRSGAGCYHRRVLCS